MCKVFVKCVSVRVFFISCVFCCQVLLSVLWTFFHKWIVHISDKRNATVGREESEDSSNYSKLIPSVTSSINIIDL